MVSRGDLLAADMPGEGEAGEGEAGDSPVIDLARGDVVSLTPDDDAMTVLQVMVDEQVDHVPVLRGDELVGICTRTDLLAVHHARREHEQRQPRVRLRHPRGRSAKLDG
jgi:CBS domain-containing protein